MYTCKFCYASDQVYSGRCHTCGRWGTLVDRDEMRDVPVRASDGAKGEGAELRQTSLAAVNRALGGLARAGVYLLGGEPGSGKSTLSIQLTADVEPSIYISAEETVEAVCARGVRVGAPDVRVVATTDLDRAYSLLASVKGGLCVIDSLQKFTRGHVTESKDGIARLCDAAKESDVTLLVVSHVNKAEDIAGPKQIEHAVDVVALLAPFGGQSRVLKAKKNRFGPSEIAGWLRMGGEGLYDAGPELRLPAENIPGRVLCVDRDGMPREVQARSRKKADMVIGLDPRRVKMVAALLDVHEENWILRADSDALERDTGADLAIAVAIASARSGVVVAERTCFWGELSLDGRVLGTEEDSLRADSARDMGLEVVRGSFLDEILDGLRMDIETIGELHGQE